MTAENNGTGSPEGDDPFAYLYRQEGGSDGTPAAQRPAQQPGVPRRSYNQVRAVGERQYGGAPQQPPQQPGAFPQQQGGYQQGAQQQGAHPNAHYAAPETMPGARAAMRQGGGPGGPSGGRGRGGRGGNRNGLLIGAVAVVAAVVVGIGAAMIFNDGGDAAQGAESDKSSAAPSEESGKGGGEPEESKPAEKPVGEKKPNALPKEDAATLRLDGDAHLDDAVPGAQGKGGNYVAGMNKPGSAAKWDAQLDEGGTYNLYVRYSVPGKDMKLSLVVNGKPHATGLNMKNHAKAKEGDWEKGWTYTYSTVQIDKGTNSFAISCGQGDSCDVNLDQVWLKPAGS